MDAAREMTGEREVARERRGHEDGGEIQNETEREISSPVAVGKMEKKKKEKKKKKRKKERKEK